MGKVLSFCSALDGQQVTEAKVLMWLQVLDGRSYEEVQTAIVPAYTVSLEWDCDGSRHSGCVARESETGERDHVFAG
jgi:hypothetical protein